MKEKVQRIEGKKTQKFSFEYGNDDLKGKISLLDPIKDRDKVKKLESEFRVLEYEIQEPAFDQLTAALSQVKSTGNMDVIGAGKVIWELCCIACDVEIEDNPKVLMSVCIELANEYALPIDLEIKKK